MPIALDRYDACLDPLRSKRLDAGWMDGVSFHRRAIFALNSSSFFSAWIL